MDIVLIMFFLSVISYYTIEVTINKLNYNKNVEKLLISYIINDDKFSEREINEDSIKIALRKLGSYEMRYIDKKLKSKKANEFINYLLIKTKEDKNERNLNG